MREDDAGEQTYPRMYELKSDISTRSQIPCCGAAFLPGRDPRVEDVETSLGNEVGETHDCGYEIEFEEGGGGGGGRRFMC